MTKAVYAGTFDILTNGHVWMIQQGAALFNNLIVAVGENPGKHPVFSLGERIEMLKAVTHYTNVTVATFTGRYLVDYAKEQGAGFILRGVRNSQITSTNKRSYLHSHSCQWSMNVRRTRFLTLSAVFARRRRQSRSRIA